MQANMAVKAAKFTANFAKVEEPPHQNVNALDFIANSSRRHCGVQEVVEEDLYLLFK